MEGFLKTWRQDALNKHQYDAAIFIGDKLLALTGDAKDAFWLAQVHFSMGQYNRALAFLTKNDLLAKSTSCRYLAGLCLIKQSKHDDALTVLGEANPTHLSTPAQRNRAKSTEGANKEKEKDDQKQNIKFEAAMCYLRGLVHAKSNAFDKAKECYKQAVLIDVKCFEAFDQLMKNCLMSPDEEWAFLESLDFEALVEVDKKGKVVEGSEQNPAFAKMLYTTRLSKYKNPAAFTTATDTLATHYRLGDNADLVLARAELLFTQCRFNECLKLCESIIDEDKYNFNVYPLYLACLHELNQKNKLFLVAHDMADHYPEEPVSWLAVGVYYLTISKIPEARRYFSKASMMDPHFGPAWIGFAHTFAAEGEHDQAISAYSTAARLFQGTHLPPLFLGMQHLQLNNVTLADEYLQTAFNLCKSDPLLLNELGVVFYHKDDLRQAVEYFNEALRIAEEVESNPKAWVATRANLGHAYRRQEMFEEALEAFSMVTRSGDGKDSNVYSAIGMCHLQAGRPWDAVVSLHEALAVNPQDPVATELLEKALKEHANSKSMFIGTVINSANGDVMEMSSDAEVERKVKEMTSNKKGKAPAHSKNAGRRRLGDVTGQFAGMEVSDDEI